jgi:hypothetical protein
LIRSGVAGQYHGRRAGAAPRRGAADIGIIHRLRRAAARCPSGGVAPVNDDLLTIDGQYPQPG